jgi:hypothetical protein
VIHLVRRQWVVRRQLRLLRILSELLRRRQPWMVPRRPCLLLTHLAQRQRLLLPGGRHLRRLLIPSNNLRTDFLFCFLPIPHFSHD